MFYNEQFKNRIEQFQVDEQKVLEIFRKYGVISEKPIDIKDFVKEINSTIYNIFIYSSTTSN